MHSSSGEITDESASYLRIEERELAALFGYLSEGTPRLQHFAEIVTDLAKLEPLDGGVTLLCCSVGFERPRYHYGCADLSEPLAKKPLIAADYPFLDVFWTMLIFFVWVAWFMLLFRVIGDVFRRHDVGGGVSRCS